MVIYELGIINNGVPLISNQYYEEYNLSVDPMLRGGFLSALNSFAEEVFSDSIESFSLKNFKIILFTHPFRESSSSRVIYYIVGDKKVNLKIATKALTRVAEAFTKIFSYMETLSSDLSCYYDFSNIINGILGDLTKKPEDRLKSVFG